MRAVLIMAIALALAVCQTPAQAAEDFTCPAEVENDQTAGGQPQSFKFRYVSFFDGDPKDLADLAPEEGPDPAKLEQRWQFTRTKDRPIIMICRYHGTTQTVQKQVPASIKECRLEGLITDKGEIVGSPKLECR